MPEQKPAVGRIVHYALPEGHPSAGAIRPAIIVQVWSDTCVNLHVFHDPANESPIEPNHCSSVVEGTGPRSWRWPARVG